MRCDAMRCSLPAPRGSSSNNPRLRCIQRSLDQVLSLLHHFKFTEAEIKYLSKVLPNATPAFFSFLRNLDCSEVTVKAIEPGSLVFPRIPLLTVSGPLVVCQLLETPLLTLINYPSLVSTNAARYRLAAGPDPTLLEFGLRRAQGPDGGFSASKYSFLGGFDGTSNVLAGMMLPELKVSGTMAHSYVMAYSAWSDFGGDEAFGQSVMSWREKLGLKSSLSELAAFASYAMSFPSGFLALIDTYDTLEGCWNFVAVSMALAERGEVPLGIRLDSGDLAYLSRECRKVFMGEFAN